MLWHAIRDLPHSVLVYRGVWDQSGPGSSRAWSATTGTSATLVPFHWALFRQSRGGRQGPRRGVRVRDGQGTAEVAA